MHVVEARPVTNEEKRILSGRERVEMYRRAIAEARAPGRPLPMAEHHVRALEALDNHDKRAPDDVRRFKVKVGAQHKPDEKGESMVYVFDLYIAADEPTAEKIDLYARWACGLAYDAVRIHVLKIKEMSKQAYDAAVAAI